MCLYPVSDGCWNTVLCMYTLDDVLSLDASAPAPASAFVLFFLFSYTHMCRLGSSFVLFLFFLYAELTHLVG